MPQHANQRQEVFWGLHVNLNPFLGVPSKPNPCLVGEPNIWFDVQVGTRTQRISIDRKRRGRPPRSATNDRPFKNLGGERGSTAATAASAPDVTEDHGPTKSQPMFPAPSSETGGSLPPSAPETPPTCAQMTSHTGNGSLPPSAPKAPPTDGKVHLRCRLHPLQLLVGSIPYNHHGSGGSCLADPRLCSTHIRLALFSRPVML